MARWLWIPVVVALLGDPPGGAGADDGLDYAHLVGQLIDLDRLPRLEQGVVCRQFSSYDRRSRYDAATDSYVDWGANGDSGNYIRIEPSGEAVMAEMNGPGCIWRIWSANPQGRIRFYLDGAEKPTYEFEFPSLFTGGMEPFEPPLVWTRIRSGRDRGACDCYVPIPFAKGCRVTADRGHRQYYIIDYSLYPEGTKVESFRLPLDAEASAAIETVSRAWGACGKDPQPPPSGKAKTEERSLRLPPRKTMLIAAIEGPATICAFRAKLTSEEPAFLRNVVLRFHWDGEEEPSVDAPFGDFFASGFAEEPFRSLPIGVTGEANYCYWRMPFRKDAKLVAVNEGVAPAELKCEIVWVPGEVPEGTATFHAKWRRENPCESFDYPFLSCEGRGRFVGVALGVNNIRGGWWGEGDEKVYVDGEKFPSWFGTGSEDYFGDAWGIRHFVNPFHGCPYTAGRRQVCYRWHITDSIPFTKSFRMTIENYAHRREERKGGVREMNDYSSTAYWYQVEPHKDFFEPLPPQRRVP